MCSRRRRRRACFSVFADGSRRRVHSKVGSKRKLVLQSVSRGPREQHPLHGRRRQQHFRRAVLHLRPRGHRGQNEGVPCRKCEFRSLWTVLLRWFLIFGWMILAARFLESAAAWPGAWQGGRAEPRVSLFAAGSGKIRVSLCEKLLMSLLRGRTGLSIPAGLVWNLSPRRAWKGVAWVVASGGGVWLPMKCTR